MDPNAPTETTPATPPGETPPAASPSLVNADGTFVENWHTTLDPSYAGNETLAGIKDVAGLAKMTVNAQSLVGKRGVPLPADPTDTAGWDAFYKAAGWPETAEAYPEIVPAEMPKGMSPDPELDTQWRQWCHDAHLTPAQMKVMTERVQAFNVSSHNLTEQGKAAEMETATTALKNQWQGKYEANVQLANTAAAAFADEAELAHFKEAGYLDDPAFLAVMHKIGGAISPDRLHAKSDGGIDASGIQSQIDEIMASDVYMKETGARHNAATARVMQLRNQLHAAG